MAGMRVDVSGAVDGGPLDGPLRGKRPLGGLREKFLRSPGREILKSPGRGGGGLVGVERVDGEKDVGQIL